MPTFAVSKFDPESDPSRPKVGAEFESNGKKYVIRKVDWRDKKKFVQALMRGETEETEDKLGHDEILYEQHKDRIFVMWILWVDKID